MNNKIATNIRKLRKRKDITQEELARFLGVSYQAISKWERGEGFPDITLLPSLANFFEVSIDDLFGMNQIRDQKYINDIYIKEHEFVEQGKYDEAVKILRNALKTFPNNCSLMSELAIVLSFSDVTSKAGKNLIKEATTLCEYVIGTSTSEKVRSTTRTLLCFLYKNLDEEDKAITLAKTLPHFWECRELILPNLLEYPSSKDKLKESIKIILSILNERYKWVENENNDVEYKKMVSIGLASANHLSCSQETIIEFLDKIYS